MGTIKIRFVVAGLTRNPFVECVLARDAETSSA